MAFNLNGAFLHAKQEGRRIRKFDMARELWTESSLRSAQANFSNLCSGVTKKIDIEMVPVICEKLGVTADYLFGLTQQPTREGELEELRKRVIELLDSFDSIAGEIRKNL